MNTQELFAAIVELETLAIRSGIQVTLHASLCGCSDAGECATEPAVNHRLSVFHRDNLRLRIAEALDELGKD